MTTPAEVDRLLRSNLERVFNERDPERRLVALRELYASDAVVHDPQGSTSGLERINQLVTGLLAQFPADFRFVPTESALGHHGLGVLPWRSSPGGPTGFDVGQVRDGRIQSLHVFIR